LQTKRISLECPVKGQSLGLMAISNVLVRANIDGVETIRPYNIINSGKQIRDNGHFDFLVKLYPEGKMGSHLFGLQPGDTVEFKGPDRQFIYKPNSVDTVAMIAGGTGVTPMLQLIEGVLSNPRDRTKLVLVYACRSKNDIALKKDIDALAAAHPVRLKVVYTVEEPGFAGGVGRLLWVGGGYVRTGRVDEALLRKELPAPDGKVQVIVCGPGAMVAGVAGAKVQGGFEAGSCAERFRMQQGELSGMLQAMGFRPAQVWKL
jgi:cytochrome-b5 reductase